MIRTARPAIDPRVTSAFGTTKDGQPLSYNRAPSADLSGWIARLSVTEIDLAPGYTLSCGLFADTAGVRIQLAGDVELPTASGMQRFAPGALFCGPQSRLMPIRLQGRLVSLGFSIRPSAYFALLGAQFRQSVDQVELAQRGSNLERLTLALPPGGTPEDWFNALEDLCRAHIAGLAGAAPEPVTAKFEEIAFANPAMSVAEAAREIGVDRRRLERLVSRDFAMPPKQVLKRARALDMASALRGVADADEAEALALRYYDESHLIREFIELFGMSPRQFSALPQPLLTINLEIRQARRLEMMKRIGPGDRRPWE